MKAKTTLAMAAAALLSGITAASAAASSHSGMPATDSLSLSATQQKTAWNDLNKRQSSQNAPTGFDAAPGAVVPKSLSLRAVTYKAARDISSLRPFDFAMVQGKLLIVNPSNRKIAEVISG
jgi:hypothetical protein